MKCYKKKIVFIFTPNQLSVVDGKARPSTQNGALAQLTSGACCPQT